MYSVKNREFWLKTCFAKFWQNQARTSHVPHNLVRMRIIVYGRWPRSMNNNEVNIRSKHGLAIGQNQYKKTSNGQVLASKTDQWICDSLSLKNCVLFPHWLGSLGSLHPSTIQNPGHGVLIVCSSGSSTNSSAWHRVITWKMRAEYTKWHKITV